MPKTPLMLEFQITKEYLGFATHLAYLGPLYEEVLQSDTYGARHGLDRGEGDRRLAGRAHALTGIAGVANIGSDRNWSGSHFNQANWYAFGRLAWDPGHVRARRSPRNGCGRRSPNDAAFVHAGGRHDDGLARGGGRLHDAARAASHDGRAAITTARRPGMRAARAPTGRRSITTAPTRTASASTAPPPAATRSRSTRAPVAAEFGDREARAGELPALVPPCAVGLPHAVPAARCGTNWSPATRAASTR